MIASRLPAVFACPHCRRSLPEYYRAVYTCGVSWLDWCYECWIELPVDERLPGQAYSDALGDVIARALRSGASLREVAAGLGVSTRSVRRYCHREGLVKNLADEPCQKRELSCA